MRHVFRFLTQCNALRISIPLLLLILSGCGITPSSRSDVHLSCNESSLARSDAVVVPDPGFTAVEYESEKEGYCTITLPAANYSMSVFIEWSNGWQQYIQLAERMEFRSETLYRIRVLETGREHTVLQSIRFQDLSETEEAVLKAASLPIVIIAAFIAAPVLLYMDDETPRGPPAENCCYLWLEKLPSGDVITGQAPEKQ